MEKILVQVKNIETKSQLLKRSQDPLYIRPPQGEGWDLWVI